MQVVKRADQTNMLGQQHAVTKHITAHITNTDNIEIFALRIVIHFTEVALHRFPRAARCNTHFLVVITGTAA